MNGDLKRIYNNRFSALEGEEKRRLWELLVKAFLQQYFGTDATIIDLGCGFCEFINAVKGNKKYAYDLEEAFAKFAAPEVEFLQAVSGKQIPLPDDTCDRAFASNFFEHLSSKEEVLFILREAYRVLKPKGYIVVIQPNIALLGGAYWDFFDHLVPLTEKSLLEAMQIAGFRLYYLRRRFLPYTTKGKCSLSPLLFRLYLGLRPFQRIFGKQSLIIAEKPYA